MAVAANSGGVEGENDGSQDLGYPEETPNEFGTATEAAYAFRRAKEMSEEGHSREEIETELQQRLNLQNAIITVVVGGATAYAGLNVMSSIGSSMNLSEGDMFYNASTSLESGIESFFTNLPTVFVVIALVLIIGYLTLLRGR